MSGPTKIAGRSARATLGGDVAAVDAADFAHGGFDLDAEDASVVFEHEVVGGGVAPGFGEHESVLGGAGHEAEFGPLAAEFAVFDLAAWVHILAKKKARPWKGPRLGFCFYI